MIDNFPSKMLSDPEQLGKYLIQGVLGEGGMGVVYKGYDPQLAREVAIKTIRRSLLAGKAGKELRDRFNREAKAEGSLVHPNIVAVYEYQSNEEGTPFFVMEYVEGKCLKDYLSRGMHFNLDMSLHIINQILCALAYSHKRGVVHRDIKPANILWLEDDTIKIADFGIAKIEASEITQTGQILGTPQYASPEQALGLKTDARSDIYSTGVLFYELVSGLKPFAGNPLAEVAKLDDSHFDKLEISEPELLQLFKGIIRKSLEKDPDKRFQSADEFVKALEHLKVKAEAIKPMHGLLSSEGLLKRLLTNKWLLMTTSSFIGGGILLVTYFISEPQNEPVIETVFVESVSNGLPSTNKIKPLLKENNNSSEQRMKVSRLLRTANLHFKVGRLIAPEGSNAFHAYQLVLELDPTNETAQSAIESIQDKILTHTKQLVDRGEIERAKSQLMLAKSLFPNNHLLQSLSENIK